MLAWKCWCIVSLKPGRMSNPSWPKMVLAASRVKLSLVLEEEEEMVVGDWWWKWW